MRGSRPRGGGHSKGYCRMKGSEVRDLSMWQMRTSLRGHELRQSRFQWRARLHRPSANIIIWLPELAWESRRVFDERIGRAAKKR